MTSIEQARMEVEGRVREAIARVETAERRTATETETAVFTCLLSLGCALMKLFFARQLERFRSTSQLYELEGRRFALVGTETATTGTRFGKVEWRRPVGRAVDAPPSARDLPLDRQLELAGGFTLPVVSTVAKLCARMAFASARAVYRDVFRWCPSSRAVLRIVDATGQRARPLLEQAPAPEGDGEVLVISVDGKGAPMISSREAARRRRPRGRCNRNGRHARRHRRRMHPRIRRAPGTKSKNAKVAAVGVLYTLKRGADGRLEGPLNKRVYATFESFRALFEWIKDEAVKRGYGTATFTKVLFVADGAETIWTLQQEFFPDAEVCLDWFHVVEKLWKAGKRIVAGRGLSRVRLEAWVAEQKRRLRKGQLATVLAELRDALEATAPTGPGTATRREVLGKIVAHFETHAHRMQYARLRRQDLDIGSGVVEGAVRHLVGVRLDGCGMRWGRDRAEAVLHLRCVLLNGLWDDFERSLTQPPRFRLRPQPVPARTHDTVIKKAA